MHVLAQEAGDAAAAAQAEEEAGAAPSAASTKPASDGSNASETAHFEAIKEKKSSLENGIAAFNRSAAFWLSNHMHAGSIPKCVDAVTLLPSITFRQQLPDRY